MKEKQENGEIVIDVYADGGEISNGEYHKGNPNVTYFNFGGTSLIGLCGDSISLAREITSGIESHLKRNHQLASIKFNFPNCHEQFAPTLDGYFGRPVVFNKVVSLKPFPQRRRPALSRALNRIGHVNDYKRNQIKLVV